MAGSGVPGRGGGGGAVAHIDQVAAQEQLEGEAHLVRVRVRVG